ncbi:PcfJ domain-containing protein [Rhodopseudomonas palustris]|nr:PcfJ domain-containing protein [Rhodopseudomonas palustris]
MLSQSKADNFNALLSTELVAEKSIERRQRKWQCMLSEMLVGEYLIMPLTSMKLLKSESYHMNNCCRDYVDQCAKMKYCLFSIRSRSGERLATLGLNCRGGYWRLDQCSGPSGSEVLEETRAYLDEDGELQEELLATELYYVAHEVARLMNSAGGQKKSH